MANKHLKKCPTSFVIRELRIKTAMRFQFTPTRMAITRQTNNKCRWGCREIGIFIHYWWECKMVELLWKTVWKILKMPLYLNWWMDKRSMVYIHTLEHYPFPKYGIYPHTGTLFGNKNKVLIHAITWVNLENIMLSESSQTQKAT